MGIGLDVYSAHQQREASKDEKRARKAERRMQAIRTARERRRQIQEAQRLQSETEVTAVATGTTQTSAVAQAQGGIQTQLATNLSFLDQMKGLTDRQSIFLQRAEHHRQRATTASAISSVGKEVSRQAMSIYSGGAA